MRIKKSAFFVLFLAMVVALSGCGKKSEPQAGNGRVNERKENSASTTPVSGDGQVVAANSLETVQMKINTEDIATSSGKTASSTSEEVDTSNWKTYRNEEYDFEVKYPFAWIYDNNLNKLVNNEDIIFKTRFFEDKDSLGIEEWVDQNDFFETKKYKNADSDEFIPYGVDEPIDITSQDGSNFKVYYSVGEAGMSSGTAITKKENKLIILSYSTGPLDEKKRDEEKEKFKNVIKSFKIDFKK